jgi:predicted transcriptional regulator
VLENQHDILISVKPIFVDQMIRGCKTVELRRRRLPAKAGTRIWIYSTLPTGKLTAIGIVSSVHCCSPTDIWNKFGPKTGVSIMDFNNYFAGVQNGCAIVFTKITGLDRLLSLSDLRAHLGAFSPPQFFRTLQPKDPELKLFCSLLKENMGSSRSYYSNLENKNVESLLI